MCFILDFSFFAYYVKFCPLQTFIIIDSHDKIDLLKAINYEFLLFYNLFGFRFYFKYFKGFIFFSNNNYKDFY